MTYIGKSPSNLSGIWLPEPVRRRRNSNSWVSTIAATGGDTINDIVDNGIAYRVHLFTTVGTRTFSVTGAGDFEYLIIGGGGGGSGY